MDFKQLLTKYVANVAAAEGIAFATNPDLSPCGMLSMGFTDEEIQVLESEIFPTVKNWDKDPL
ncbi:MAG: hypothetical protein KAJ39_01335 [Gammaproteobacteria bacterium]|nr:hypothetical protein [Gammaproteobacteria bacterium]